ncbi:polyisoprenoid-binding protein [Alicyclobacillaceae bacterium I2511]|nr:polyisoprenoid-binding protein [Alicyclobacillaceae bacterium I2511]
MAREWVIDPVHSEVEFSVKHMMIANVKGRFEKFSGVITGDPENWEQGAVQVTIDANSIHTRDEQRDTHLRSSDFFDVQQFPDFQFTSQTIRNKENGSYMIEGPLTLHGVTKSIILQATFEGQIRDPYGNDRISFSADTALNRKDFGLNWNSLLEAGGVMVGDAVKISLAIEAYSPVQA